MPLAITLVGMQARTQRFLACRSLDQLAFVLRRAPTMLASLAEHPQYREFYVPKKNGDKRLIEDPQPPLKKPLRKLNDFLQAVYFFHRTESAYGFLTNPVDDPQPRHILSNARVHLGCTWLLNMDMQDFFHTISEERVLEIFEAPLFNFPRDVAAVLAGLCCYKGRLPMGAPTSPILSNLASIPLDQDLQHYAKERGWAYTRYADDMSFSGHSPIEAIHVEEISAIVQQYDYRINPAKTRIFAPGGAPKEVTGLLIENQDVALTAEYYTQLQAAIEHLSLVVDAKYSTSAGQVHFTPWLNELQQQVQGKLAFAGHILGPEAPQYLELERNFELALQPPEYFGPLTWLEFGYEHLKF
ncbi:MAG: reverse transcriptase family protein [Haliscomenobacter sp.]|uniref:reverse transcriptase family protein n=1 Tax=Haliscomenobacter sp. TaxID=2717303 RepID=UPI0029A50B1A|nr:reverse transcriptase family protein [Haliscomenobacter sp.]MDX2072060.1 reverse transcriptase family protein [Haliscomenobacter sp.]